MPVSAVILITVQLIVVAVLVLWLQGHRRRERLRSRLGYRDDIEEQLVDAGGTRPNWLARTLLRAGDTRDAAVRLFLTKAIVFGVIGVVVTLLIHALGLAESLDRAFAMLPANLGRTVDPLSDILPYLIGGFVVLYPWLALYDRRKNLVARVEMELPMTLELLATMVQAGLGFDAALAALFPIMDPKSPLVRELSLMHLQLRSGGSRRNAFLELRARLDIPTISMWSTAMVGAEELGASVGEALRTQATELQAKRRGQAIVRAQALGVKLVFPVVICFLPGLFVITLGPALAGLLELIDASVAGISR